MIDGAREVGRRVTRLVLGLGGLLAVLAGAGWGPADALGALAGTLLVAANLAGLHWGAARVCQGAVGSLTGGRRALWASASGLRLLAVALVVGLLASQGWVGVRGLLAVLASWPIAIVLVGLRAARTA
jgi:hypothetical protein